MTHKKRVTVEDTLMRFCEPERVKRIHLETLIKVINRTQRMGVFNPENRYQIHQFPKSIWRAFYNRHAEKMLASPRSSVVDIALEFRARDQAAAALKAMNDVLELHVPKN